MDASTPATETAAAGPALFGGNVTGTVLGVVVVGMVVSVVGTAVVAVDPPG